MFNTIDLFAGAGGLSLGFMQTKKFDIKVAYEFNPAMQETYKKNHPGVAVFGDVRDANFAEIKEKYGDIDVVIGGPPCQGFSNANRQKNHAISQNNSLVKQYIRAILELKPKAFVMENVSMLRSDVHRFYLCEDDLELVESNVIETANTELALLDAEFMFDGAINIVQSEQEIARYKWDDFDYLELNVIYKASKNATKFKAVLEKHRPRLIKISEKHIRPNENDFIINADMVAFNAMLDYYAGKIEESQIKALIEPAIMYQRMISKAWRMTERFFRMQARSRQRLPRQKPRLNLKSIVLFRTDYLCLILISTCWNWKRMRRSNRIGSLFQCWIFRYDKVECMGDRPSIRAKIAVDLFFVGRTDKVETMAGPRKI